MGGIRMTPAGMQFLREMIIEALGNKEQQDEMIKIAQALNIDLDAVREIDKAIERIKLELDILPNWFLLMAFINGKELEVLLRSERVSKETKENLDKYPRIIPETREIIKEMLLKLLDEKS